MRARCMMPHDAERDTYLVLGLRGSTRVIGYANRTVAWLEWSPFRSALAELESAKAA